MPAVARLLGLKFDSEEKTAKKGQRTICRFQKSRHGNMLFCVSMSDVPRNQELIEKLEEDAAERFEQVTYPKRSVPFLLERENEMKPIGARV